MSKSSSCSLPTSSLLSSRLPDLSACILHPHSLGQVRSGKVSRKDLAPRRSCLETERTSFLDSTFPSSAGRSLTVVESHNGLSHSNEKEDMTDLNSTGEFSRHLIQGKKTGRDNVKALDSIYLKFKSTFLLGLKRILFYFQICVYM